jgi:hypothetical protein
MNQNQQIAIDPAAAGSDNIRNGKVKMKLNLHRYLS